MYYHSSQDFFNVGFYCFVWITIHAAVQKYIWKVCVCLCVHLCWSRSFLWRTQQTVKCLNKHLPPTETSTYYDSGCLAVFYLVFVIWGLGIFLTNGDPTLATTDLLTEHWLEYQSKIFMRCVLLCGVIYEAIVGWSFSVRSSSFSCWLKWVSGCTVTYG